MNQRIRHCGVVEQVEDGCVHVRIVQTSACAACKVASYCNAAESKEKMIDVFCDAATEYSVGQQVVVSTSGQVAAKALLWAFGVPFVLLMSVLVLVLVLTANEGWAALSALVALVPYYIILWLFRDKMREQLTFEIE